MKVIGIITGILMMILGGYAMAVPFRTFLGIGWFLGALFLVNGIEMIVHALGKKKNIWQMLMGVLLAIGGVIVLFNGVQRFLTDMMLVYLIGFYVIVTGVIQICNGVKNMKAEKGVNILKIICGIFTIIAGLFAILHPILTMFSLGYLIAFALIFQGISMILFAVGMGKKKADQLEE